jgi:hypothetical protein
MGSKRPLTARKTRQTRLSAVSQIKCSDNLLKMLMWRLTIKRNVTQPQVRDTPEPFVSRVRAALSERTRELERLAVELYARGLSTRDIEDAFTDETGRRLLSRAAESEVTERL